MVIQLVDATYAPVLTPTTLTISAGEKVAVIGASGSGKTTLIRLLCGWLQPTYGQVIAPSIGDFAFIPQDLDASLNPALKVRDIICEPVAIARGNLTKARAKVPHLLSALGLDPELAHRRPHQLSGGQRQRVGIARALITNPSTIYADEALSALDAQAKKEALALLGTPELTLVLVTHDLYAAQDLATRIIVVDDGTIVEDIPADQLFPTNTDSLAPTVSPARQRLVHAATVLGAAVDHGACTSSPSPAGCEGALPC
ncbi:MAG: ATP-binding cassette domain-containing protein [Corynebacterium sp.]|uniref:ATP-binding cassette domain-containing protein n=1 Tax=Corynebacterium sp. TaxID=1720 RepID=UPI0026DABE4D|nr:ATP-binding cassette domain-containing protein [Corynebacterium sp.]MDO4761524.1 ATP-binding cassette domain-containing protein [Corynebacterium sp.]